MKKKQRILGRQLAQELTHEELGVVEGARPPISTMVATLPDWSEDT